MKKQTSKALKTFTVAMDVQTLGLTLEVKAHSREAAIALARKQINANLVVDRIKDRSVRLMAAGETELVETQAA